MESFVTLPLAIGNPVEYKRDGLEQQRRMIEKIGEIVFPFVPSTMDMPELISYLTSELELAKKEQFSLDCQSECSCCGSDKYNEPVWNDAEFAYFHAPKSGTKLERCDATLLRMMWDQEHKNG